MIYLTGEQVEALSPVKREVYNKRLMRDLERRQEEILRDWNQIPPIHSVFANSAMWIERSRLEAMAASLAIKQQFTDKLKNEITSLYEEP